MVEDPQGGESANSGAGAGAGGGAAVPAAAGVASDGTPMTTPATVMPVTPEAPLPPPPAPPTAPTPPPPPPPPPPGGNDPPEARYGFKGGAWLGGCGLLAILLIVWIEVRLAGHTPYDAGHAPLLWGLVILLLVVFMALTGLAINGKVAGLIIDNRNRVSLSKFQAACWTLLVVSTVATMAAVRIGHGGLDPVDIALPSELLAALGISAVSLVATPALLSLKSSGAEATDAEVAKTAARLDTTSAAIDSTGRVFGRTRPESAEWLDMFRGEDVSNAASPDLSKIQQFLFTLVVLGVYAGAIIQMLATKNSPLLFGPHGALPPLTEHFVWLLGISHAAYLSYKAVPHGPPPSEGSPQSGSPPDAAG